MKKILFPFKNLLNFRRIYHRIISIYLKKNPNNLKSEGILFSEFPKFALETT